MKRSLVEGTYLFSMLSVLQPEGRVLLMCSQSFDHTSLYCTSVAAQTTPFQCCNGHGIGPPPRQAIGGCRSDRKTWDWGALSR